MDEADRQYFEVLESLMSHPGWKVLMKNISEFKEAISEQWLSIRPEDLRYVQGRYNGLDQIYTFEDTLATLKAQAETPPPPPEEDMYGL